jgi:hypothetical protein
MEAMHFSYKRSVGFQQTAWHYIQKIELFRYNLNLLSENINTVGRERSETELITRGNASDLYGRLLVQISARTPTILTEVLHGFCQSFSANARILMPYIGPLLFLSSSFPIIIHYHLVIQHCVV